MGSWWIAARRVWIKSGPVHPRGIGLFASLNQLAYSLSFPIPYSVFRILYSVLCVHYTLHSERVRRLASSIGLPES